MTSIIIATNMIVVAFDTLLLILFLYLAIAAIRLVFRKNYKGAAKLGGLVALAVVLALIADMPNLYIFILKIFALSFLDDQRPFFVLSPVLR